MTKQTRAFLRDLKKLCKLHGVEISRASRFWVFGKKRNQLERVGVIKHLETSLYDLKLRKDMKAIGSKSHLTIRDISMVKTGSSHFGYERKLMEAENPIDFTL